MILSEFTGNLNIGYEDGYDITREAIDSLDELVSEASSDGDGDD